MTTLADAPATELFDQQAPLAEQPAQVFADAGNKAEQLAEQLRQQSQVLELKFAPWLTTRRARRADKLRSAATAINADQRAFSGSTPMFPSKLPVAMDACRARGIQPEAGKAAYNAYRAIAAHKTTVKKYIDGHCLPHPDKGCFIARMEHLEDITGMVQMFQAQLSGIVAQAQQHYPVLKSMAQHFRGDAFNEQDYPAELTGCFAIEIGYPSNEEYLKNEFPEIYEQEQQRIAAQFAEAVAMSEEMFIAELTDLVTTLRNKCAGLSDGSTKRLYNSAFDGFTEFFQKFERLNLGSNNTLSDLIDQARATMNGVDHDKVKTDSVLRQELIGKFDSLKDDLDGLLEDAPVRVIDV